jgi:hypothetical protein
MSPIGYLEPRGDGTVDVQLSDIVPQLTSQSCSFGWSS